jgi:hypothetical protein
MVWCGLREGKKEEDWIEGERTREELAKRGQGGVKWTCAFGSGTGNTTPPSMAGFQFLVFGLEGWGEAVEIRLPISTTKDRVPINGLFPSSESPRNLGSQPVCPRQIFWHLVGEGTGTRWVSGAQLPNPCHPKSRVWWWLLPPSLHALSLVLVWAPPTNPKGPRTHLSKMEPTAPPPSSTLTPPPSCTGTTLRGATSTSTFRRFLSHRSRSSGGPVLTVHGLSMNL